MRSTNGINRQIQDHARRLKTSQDLGPLIERLGQAKIVMLGEASHGTHEFYDWRKVISQQLIDHYGFNFITVEGDWPPCQEINQYIQNEEARRETEVLEHFNRWPTWMWSNIEVLQLMEWMKKRNSIVQKSRQVGFYGLDVYSLFESVEVVLQKLEEINPFMARRARTRYSCFDPFQKNEQRYVRSLLEFPEGCQEQVVQTLQELLKFRLDGLGDRETILFDVRQNARVVKNAENYYRTMIHGNEDSWNIRDRHMMETLNMLMDHYGPDARGIVWAHNTHIGDYRATDMVEQGQVNIGGLAREHYGEDSVALVGFGTYEGTVIASHAWDGPIEEMKVPPGKRGSYEDFFHALIPSVGHPQFYFIFDPESRNGPLAEVRGHRAIGVVYSPLHERWGNYVPTSLANRYDAFIFIDQTRALEPLITRFEREEIPETWPAGQ